MLDKKHPMSRRFLFKFRVNPASIKLDIKFFNYWFLARIVRHPDTITNGITNRCEDGINYVLFFDFDNIFYETVKEQLLALQSQFRMSNIIINCTSEEKDDYGKLVGSYHAFELTKRRFYDIPEILKWSNVDRNSLRVPRLFSGKSWVLRTEPKVKIGNGQIIKEKPKFKEILWAKRKPDGQQSFAHYLYLRKQFGIPYMKMNFDNSMKIQKIQYTTTSKRWHSHWVKFSM